MEAVQEEYGLETYVDAARAMPITPRTGARFQMWPFVVGVGLCFGFVGRRITPPFPPPTR